MLINNIQEFKQYLPVSLQLDFGDILPKVKLVERDIIRKKFSDEVYTIITADVPAAGSKEESLLDLLAEATAHLSLLEYISFGQVMLDSSGIHITSTENIKNAFQWQVEDLKNSCSISGWSAIESALELMETLPDEELKTAWQETDTYKTAQNSLISSLTQFQRFVHLGNSRVLFNKLIPTLDFAQEEIVMEAVGLDFWEKMLDFESEDDTTQKSRLKKAHKLASRALAYHTIGEGFTDTMLVLSDNGPLIMEQIQSSSTSTKATAKKEVVELIAKTYAAKAQGAIRELLQYCQANDEFFPEYKLSTNYISDEAQEDHIPRNDPDSGVVFF
jgi:hypothetical protein